MYLIEILLPLRDKKGRPFAARIYQSLRDDLTERYRGVTAFTRAPAEGETRAGSGKVRDDIVLFEVMTDKIDRHWWKQYRESLERTFEQDEIVVRAIALTGHPADKRKGSTKLSAHSQIITLATFASASGHRSALRSFGRYRRTQIRRSLALSTL